MKHSALISLMLFFWSAGWAQELDVSSLQKKDGFIPFYLDAEKGKIFLEIANLEKEFLYVNSLPAGIGSNDLGLDRGKLGSTRIVEFRRSGAKIFLVHKNYDFRAFSSNPQETQSVQDAFAESILWGFEIKQKTANGLLVEATDFYLQDAFGVGKQLDRQKQGTYKVDKSRSGLYEEMTKNFPKNTEVEATITLTGDAKGSLIQSVSPSPDAVSVRQRHSFIELPDEGFQTRKFDPRAGFFSISYMDFSTPIAEPIQKQLISRHRLEKTNPNAAVSEVVEPIIYYLDRGTPEPVASALIAGGNWWNQAFEAAGYKNAFRVELAPEGMDLMDVRYNVIQWVHRSTRGWSYGSSIRDPRTGEIIKGQVSLGSLRVRQDFLIAQGLLQPFEEGKEADPRLLEMALSRLRQLSAHEIGHTIGLAHSYATSAVGRSSVMDYPYPLITMDSKGNLDLSQAYEEGIGKWDKWAITYGYGYPKAGQSETDFLQTTLEQTYSDGFEFITDSDSRDPSGAHPRSHLWDNGKDAAEELIRMLQIRKNKLRSFGLNAIPEGTPHALLEEVLVPLYLMHRFQVEASSKVLGGLDYTYKIKGDNQSNHSWIPAQQQLAALDALLQTIEPEELEVPSHILELIPPRPYGFGRNRETFQSRTGPLFDPIAPAENIIDLVLTFLLNSDRANRLHLQSLQDEQLPGFQAVLDKVTSRLFENYPGTGLKQEIKFLTEASFVEQLITLAKNPKSTHAVRAITRQKLAEISRLKSEGKSVTHRSYLNQKIQAFLSLPEEINPPRDLKVPDGSPIGSDAMHCDLHD